MMAFARCPREAIKGHTADAGLCPVVNYPYDIIGNDITFAVAGNTV